MKKQLHSNWRDDLREIVDISRNINADISPSEPKTQTKSARRIEDKEVKNKVKINPVQQEEFDKIGGIILEVVELSEEEFVELDERSLSKGEEKDREKYVKGMKKSAKDFKARYGDDYKSVMYATATKMAKEERDPEKEVMGRKVADLEKKKTAFGIVKKFRQENPGSRQPKKVPGQKETEAQAENRRRGQQASRAAKYGLTSKEKKETQSRDKYYSSRD